MLHDTLEVAARVSTDHCEIWIDRINPGSDLVSRAAETGMVLRTQSGADLGQRMLAAFSDAPPTADATVLIGTDCPEFDTAYLDSAFDALDRHDLVIGPALDGGYVLIGMKHPEPRLFRDVPWGSDKVLAITRERLRQLGWHWHELPPRHDVDEPEDLSRFPDLLARAMAKPPDPAC